ncbi:hypothetical protein GCM10023091_34700 [Ravibacter arvi]|uniref:Sialidase domain-containing protein n=1 Tax=Ravibacter arvi TaxID=2051041 RepID=A0ABP8M6U2_9BACT
MLFLAGLPFSGSLQAQNALTALHIKPGPDNPRNSEGDFVTLKDGTIMLVYTRFTGNSSSDFGGSDLVARYSRDNGKTWDAEDHLVLKNEGRMNIMSVSLLRLKSGKIALFYLRKNGLADCLPLLRISSDEGKTWGAPTVCITDEMGYYVLNNNRVIQLPGGRLLMPVALHTSTFKEGASITELEKSFNNYGKIFCYYSDDEGKSWKRSDRVAVPDDVIAQEPGVVALKNGNILMFIRSDAGVQYYATSSDKGESWQQVEKSTIVSPLSPASIARIPGSNKLLLVWNNNDQKEASRKNKRTPMTIGTSVDNGKTWKRISDIETDPQGSYCYTSIHFTKDDALLNYFDWHTRGIIIKRIPLKSLR